MHYGGYLVAERLLIPDNRVEDHRGLVVDRGLFAAARVDLFGPTLHRTCAEAYPHAG